MRRCVLGWRLGHGAILDRRGHRADNNRLGLGALEDPQPTHFSPLYVGSLWWGRASRAQTARDTNLLARPPTDEMIASLAIAKWRREFNYVPNAS
jgi:hypothetical protein